jgi:hypothetical protein
MKLKISGFCLCINGMSRQNRPGDAPLFVSYVLNNRLQTLEQNHKKESNVKSSLNPGFAEPAAFSQFYELGAIPQLSGHLK